MERSSLILAILRALLLLFSIIVLALGAVASHRLNNAQDICKGLTRDQNCDLHGLIPTLQFTAFAGAWGLIAGLVGLASLFVSAIKWIIVAVVDALAALFFFAGGVVSSCDHECWVGSEQFANKSQALAVCIGKIDGFSGDLSTKSQADAAFCFLAFLVLLALIALGFVWQRSSRKL